MENDLISKKDLLEHAGISYGQLYRWKRKKLIPESWFIRKSTFTGQETFFPRKSIIERVEKIMNLKDDVSLDDLADMFSPQPAAASMTSSQLTERNIVSPTTLELSTRLLGTKQEYSFLEIVQLRITDHLLHQGDMTLTEADLLLQTFSDHREKLQGQDMNILLIRKMGVPLVLFIPTSCELLLDSQTKVIASLNLNGFAEQLKIQLT
ncbi:YhbD family protein [Fictibacillus aquaticus]|uniref:DUF4004 domain-containing protein n=1 Tax=Fictibacillus aquaticus TaxID=2021314 RepID=A0A235F6K1_9BACL|nr:YhbD family protein [Fictibacillus aquaticus]OYD56882.1 hypothetical protein CGZ90_15110 [Fictibacillus aquaticus]